MQAGGAQCGCREGGELQERAAGERGFGGRGCKVSVGVDLERGGWTLGLFKGFMGAFLLLGLGQARRVLAGSQALPNGLAVHDLTS